MNHENYGKLKALRLSGMAEEYERQERLDDIDSYSFNQRLTLLIDAESDKQYNNKILRNLKNAKFSEEQARLSKIRYDKDRHLDQSLITELATNRYIHKKRNIIITGASGSGKSYLGNAFGVNACEQGFRVKYVRLPDLLQELEFAKIHSTYGKTIRLYQNCDLLILDEWVLIPTDENEQRHLLELLERRYRIGATILCSQYSIEAWHDKLGGGALADAILDRIIPQATKIFIDGDVSMRSKILE